MAAMDPAEATLFAEPGNETGFARPNPEHPLTGPVRRLAAYANMRREAGGPPPPAPSAMTSPTPCRTPPHIPDSSARDKPYPAWPKNWTPPAS